MPLFMPYECLRYWLLCGWLCTAQMHTLVVFNCTDLREIKQDAEVIIDYRFRHISTSSQNVDEGHEKTTN